MFQSQKKTTDKKKSAFATQKNTLANDDDSKESKKDKISTTKRKATVAALSLDKQKSIIRKPNITVKDKGRREEQRTGSVTKTRYFPSQKDIIHRVVKEEKMKREINNQSNNKTKKLSQGEETDRPRTATLKKASVSQMHVIKSLSPEEIQSSTSTSSKEEQINYEDDFDSYESDFEDETTSVSETDNIYMENINENCNSSNSSIDDVLVTNRQTSCVSKEYKLDSGNFDLIVKNNNTKAVQELLPSVPSPHNNNSSLLSDEGYEEDKAVFKKVHGYNFEKTKINHHKRCRGEEIQTMIKFNKCYFATFEMIPVPYEHFIQIHGQTSGIQCGIQTVSTSTKDENVQTDEIVTITKLTQFPAVFSTKTQKPNWELYKQELLGVGNDLSTEQTQEEEKEQEVTPYKFISSIKNSATIILSLLNNESNKRFHPNNTNENESFSAGSIKTCTQDLEVLKDTSLVNLYTSNNSNNFLTLHLPTNSKKFTEVSYICVWSAFTLQQPLALLRTLGRPTCADFGHENINYVFVSYNDGTLSLWNTSNESQNEKYCFQSLPSFKTKIKESHQTKITSVICVKNSDPEKGHDLEEKVCSLDEDGLVIFWTTITKKHPKWSVSLVQNFQLDLKSMCSRSYYDVEFKTLCFNPLDPNHLFVLSNSDRILHCFSTGNKTYPKNYKTDELSIVTSIDCCPFSSTYFIVGYENGTVALFSRHMQRSLMILSNEVSGKRASIDTVQWSNEKPCIFYAKDNKNVLHVWNLALSDIFPIYSIPFKENVVSIKVTTLQKRQNVYMIIATKDGQLSVHFLNNEHKSLTNEEYDTDVKYFLNYIKRL